MNKILENLPYQLPYIPGIILAFFTIFIVHELGHYVAARIFGMKVERFNVGFGRKLWSRTDSYGTLWSVHLWPLGGYVTINSLSFEEQADAAPRRLWQQTLTVLAGPLANIIFLPFVILPLCFVITGYPISIPAVSAIERDMPAAKAEFEYGDVILSINGRKILSHKEMVENVENSNGAILQMKVRRLAGETETIVVRPEHESYTEDKTGIPRSHYRIGILNIPVGMPLKMVRHIGTQPFPEDSDTEEMRAALITHFNRSFLLGLKMGDGETHFYQTFLPEELNTHLKKPDHREENIFYPGPYKDNLFLRMSMTEAVHIGLKETLKLLTHLVKVPFQIFPLDPEIFGERIRFIDESDFFWHIILYKYAYTVALLSFIIGCVNLLPLPRLDGDYLVAYGIEAVKKRRAKRKERATVMAVIIFLVYSLFLFSNLSDIPNFIEMKLEKWQERIEELSEE